MDFVILLSRRLGPRHYVIFQGTFCNVPGYIIPDLLGPPNNPESNFGRVTQRWAIGGAGAYCFGCGKERVPLNTLNTEVLGAEIP